MAIRLSGYFLLLAILLSLPAPTCLLHASLTPENMVPACMAAENDGHLPTVLNLDDLNKTNIGVLAGTIFDQVAENNLDYVSVVYFDNYPQMEEALIASAITITPERSITMSFSPGYFHTSVVALVRK